jgi:hypothetical protein
LNNVGLALVLFFGVAALAAIVYYVVARRAGRTHRHTGAEVFDSRMNRREDEPAAIRAIFALLYFGILIAIARLAWLTVMGAEG